MGLYADRKGRKAGLTLSVTLMAVGSLAIAVLPPAAVIGPIALSDAMRPDTLYRLPP